MSARRWRPSLPGTLLTVCAVAVSAWLVSSTEWVERDVPRPLGGEAASNRQYVLERILHSVGARTVEREDLSQLPPSQATLLLTGWDWDVLPERSRAVRQWVEGGGNLVIDSGGLVGRSDSGGSWIPIEVARPKKVEKAPADAKKPEVATVQKPLAPPPECWRVAEPEGVPAAYPGESAGGLNLCTTRGLHLVARRRAPSWALADDGGNDVIRVTVGAGSVTAVSGWSFLQGLFDNRALLKGDNALIAVAALQAHAGAEVWLVSGRGGQPLLAWLWGHARTVLLTGALALALWLWRASTRFGPIEAAPPLARRSMGEQIAGTAAFLWRRSPAALHAVQVRALDEAAALRVRGYARLDRVDRAGAIAQATGLEAAGLNRALSPAVVKGAHGLARVLALLETARRRLLQAAPARASLAGGAATINTSEGTR